jgi:hypothetical protein
MPMPMPMQCCPMQCIMQMRKNVCLSLLSCPGEDRVLVRFGGVVARLGGKGEGRVGWCIG